MRDDNLPLVNPGGLLSRPEPWNTAALGTQGQASCTVTIGGSETDDDELTFTLNSTQLPSGSLALQMTTAGGQSINSIATALRDLINNNPLLAYLGITATVASAVVTVKWPPGPLGNHASIVFTKSEGATETATITKFSGGSGYVTPVRDVAFAYNRTVIRLTGGRPVLVDFLQLQAMLADGIEVK